MKLGQVLIEGRLTAAVFDNSEAHPIPGYSLRELVQRGERDRASLTELAKRYVTHAKEYHAPALPIEPREVWACGCTYERSVSYREPEPGARGGFRRQVFAGPRPEIFFKGTARTCCGPNAKIGVRRDSALTAAEAELAVLLGSKGKILAYTLANDVSARDIELENPLYLPQSKIYTGSCALGPWFVTADELTDPYSLEIRCTVRRGDRTLFEGSAPTSRMCRKIEELIEYLLRANPVPAASVLLTGTGIIVPEEAALAEGDVVTIEAAGIGVLENEAALVG